MWKAEEIFNLANQNWTRNNKFWVELSFEKGKKIEQYLRPLTQNPKLFNSTIIDINLYDSVADPIEQYINEKYLIAPGRLQSSQISIKFRDRNQNELYKMFHNALYESKREYPDDISFCFKFYAEPSWNETDQSVILSAPESIITALSGLVLDNASQNQITEFTVTWRCPRFYANGENK